MLLTCTNLQSKTQLANTEKQSSHLRHAFRSFNNLYPCSYSATFTKIIHYHNVGYETSLVGHETTKHPSGFTWHSTKLLTSDTLCVFLFCCIPAVQLEHYRKEPIHTASPQSPCSLVSRTIVALSAVFDS